MANKKLSKTGGNAGYQITRAHTLTIADFSECGHRVLQTRAVNVEA